MANKIVVTILTSRRPAYLEKTLSSFFGLNNSQLFLVLALVNGKDEDTEKVIARYRDRIHHVFYSGTNLGFAGGWNLLMKKAVELELPYVIHIEDDFISRESISDYLPELVELMEQNNNIGFIKLRSIGDRVKDYNMVTKKKIECRKIGNIGIGNAHFTSNPTITKSSVIRNIFPVISENEAMRKYEKLGLETGQLFADCFFHIGEKKALKY